MLFYFTNIVLDVTWGATWWVGTKTASGLYNLSNYLIYGSEVTEDQMKEIIVIDDCEKEQEKYNELMSEIRNLRDEIKELKKE